MAQLVVEFLEAAWAFTLAHATLFGTLSLLASAAILVSPALRVRPWRSRSRNENAVVTALTPILLAQQARLLVSTLDLDEAAATAGVGTAEARLALPRLAAKEPRLRSTGYDGKTLLFFCPVENESAPPTVGWTARRRAATARRKLERLTAQRAILAFRREQLEDAAAALETREEHLRRQFPTAATDAARRRIVSDVGCARRDLQHRLAMAEVVRMQHEVASAAIQALRLHMHCAAPSLPDADQLAAAVAEAETALEQLRDRSDTAAAVDEHLRERLHPPIDEARLLAELRASHTPAPSPPTRPTERTERASESPYGADEGRGSESGATEQTRDVSARTRRPAEPA